MAKIIKKKEKKISSSKKSELRVNVDKKVIERFEDACKRNAMDKDQLIENMMREFAERMELYAKQVEMSKKLLKDQMIMNEKTIKEYENQIKKGKNPPKINEEIKKEGADLPYTG